MSKPFTVVYVSTNSMCAGTYQGQHESYRSALLMVSDLVKRNDVSEVFVQNVHGHSEHFKSTPPKNSDLNADAILSKFKNVI